ncbi:MAG: hypothetical protein E7616_06280 [Ruminococcaceae bacterium]|nr:hypothetical protein [Oscillospiraceae bacterium]
MQIKAIVYTSETGNTAKYAKKLGEKTKLKVYSLEQALTALPDGTEIVYLGWLMASMVKGYKTAAKKFRILLVCGVCLGTSGSQLEEVRKMNAIDEKVPLFTLQGGFDMQKLHGMNKFMMKIMRRILKNQIEKKPEKTPDDEKIVWMLDKGGSVVCEEYLEPVIKQIECI